MFQPKPLHYAALLVLFSAAANAQSPPNNRFSGSANLAGPAGESADHRFRLDAGLFPPNTQPIDEKPPLSATTNAAPMVYEQSGGRFGLTAQMHNPVLDKALAAACGPANLFENGFE
jgi:hypothetical protein